MAVSESAKLKGVYWPGMDIFDSATPEMRRKRNQKKDSSVVEQLELNSQEVEATELIFTPQGSFKRRRRISCSESDDEDEIEIKAESPQPIRRRLALANLDANATRRLRSNRPARFSYSTARNQYYEDRSQPHYGNACNQRAPQRKRGAFDVFHDDIDDDEPFSQSTSSTNFTSGFPHQPLSSLGPVFGSYKPFNDPFQFEEKENVLPPFQQSNYGSLHGHHGIASHFSGNAYDLGHEQYGFQYNSPLYNDNTVYQQENRDGDDDDDDDQRTITAPPSPSTG